MVFEVADGTFGNVAAVYIGGHELVCGLPDVSDVATVLLACFIFEDLIVYDVAAHLEAGHDAGLCGDTVAILGGLEGFDEDDVGVAMVGDHEVLVAAEGAEWEAARVVGVDSTGGFDPEVELFRSARRERFINGVGWRVKLIVVCGLGLGGVDALL